MLYLNFYRHYENKALSPATKLNDYASWQGGRGEGGISLWCLNRSEIMDILVKLFYSLTVHYIEANFSELHRL